MNREEFAAQRRSDLETGDERLGPTVSASLNRWGQDGWANPIIASCLALWDDTAGDPSPRTRAARVRFRRALTASLEQTSDPHTAQAGQAETITRWLSTWTINSATAAGLTRSTTVEWVTMHDDAVRASHKAVDGQQHRVGQSFMVEGHPLAYPGEPVGPPEVWINCRCVLRPVGGEMTDSITAAGEVTLSPADFDFEEAVPWHGILAPIGKMSGDRRIFEDGAEVSFREGGAPMALRWTPTDVGSHGGAVRVANIDRAWVEDGLIKGEGTFNSSDNAAQAIELLAHSPLGVSVDLDQMVASMKNEDGTEFDFEAYQPGDPEPVLSVSSLRLAGATIVDIPAFQEAYVALGPWEDQDEAMAASAEEFTCLPCEAMAQAAQEIGPDGTLAISESAWDGSASRFDDEQWKRSCILDRGSDYDTAKTRYALPIKEPNGDLSRAGVHAAASRIGQVEAPESAKASAKRRLIAAYSTLDEEPPESLVASAFDDFTLDAEVEEFAPGTHDGPGWLTHPVDSQRLRDYWTRGKGALKIRWGVPGDFNRCRRELGKYIPNPQWLAGTCANLHKVAIRLWPGQETGKKHAVEGAVMASAFTLVASAGRTLPGAWFGDPNLQGPTPLTVTDEGQVYGHIATWGVCHIGLGLSIGRGDQCVTAPNSASNYAYFRTGVVDTDLGQIAVGHLTMGTGHASLSVKAQAAAEHYDNTGTVVADVAVGEDAHGIWFAGALRDGLTDEQVRAFKSSSLSGDWRTIGGSYEMVGALSVNVPGFPIPRLALAASGSGDEALVAAGIVERKDVVEVPLSEVVSVADIVRTTVKETLAYAERQTRLDMARARAREQRLSLVRAKVK